MEPTEQQQKRGELMLNIIKRRGKPHSDNVREYAEEYYQAVALESMPGDSPSEVMGRDWLVELLMESFDEDFIANYHLFGKWLRQG